MNIFSRKQSEKSHQTIFTADIHGVIPQYKKLLAYAKKIKADQIILGGDITPKTARGLDLIVSQRDFLIQDLSRMFSNLKNDLPNTGIYVLFGNDDAKANHDLFVADEIEPYTAIHGKRLPIADGLEIVGYSYVPMSPWGLKDWDKFDYGKVVDISDQRLIEMNLERMDYGIRTSGFESKDVSKGEKEKFKLIRVGKQDLLHKGSISFDLQSPIYLQNPEKTIFVAHAPPYGHLDVARTSNGGGLFAKPIKDRLIHAGSVAMLEYIEKTQPFLTLHGHIHSTVKRTGEYKTNIGNTISMTAGNSPRTNNLAILVFDLYNPQEAQRIIL
ncbi:hypothetical protein H8D36_03980 [archaeon]|nr:hypothetical protein [archaeon]MBL7056900.1 hypothetical protein [Candidatus Woesearchaeota archaeon]